MAISSGEFSQGIILASPTPILPSSDTTLFDTYILATLDREESASFTVVTSDLLFQFSTLLQPSFRA